MSSKETLGKLRVYKTDPRGAGRPRTHKYLLKTVLRGFSIFLGENEIRIRTVIAGLEEPIIQTIVHLTNLMEYWSKDRYI